MMALTVKRLEGLGFSVVQEDTESLERICETVASELIAECNLTYFPPEWKAIAAERAAGRFLYELWCLRSERLSESWLAGGVKDIREGDVSMSFDASVSGSTEHWLRQMMRFGEGEVEQRRRVVW